MMDEKKQIEEMARDLYHTRLTANDLCGGYDCEKCPKQNERFCDDMFQVDELQKLGYQNCKDKVVLTREEFHEMLAYKYEKELAEIECDTIYRRTRKETARDILNELATILITLKVGNILSKNIDTSAITKGGYLFVMEELKKLANQYGVEVQDE